jgi:hypothetical protein
VINEQIKLKSDKKLTLLTGKFAGIGEEERKRFPTISSIDKMTSVRALTSCPCNTSLDMEKSCCIVTNFVESAVNTREKQKPAHIKNDKK